MNSFEINFNYWFDCSISSFSLRIECLVATLIATDHELKYLEFRAVLCLWFLRTQIWTLEGVSRETQSYLVIFFFFLNISVKKSGEKWLQWFLKLKFSFSWSGGAMSVGTVLGKCEWNSWNVFPRMKNVVGNVVKIKRV